MEKNQDLWSKNIIENSGLFKNFLVKKLHSYEVAEDIFQESFIKALQTSSGPKNIDASIPWFFSILKTTLIDAYRAKNREMKKLELFKFEIEGLPIDNYDFDEICCDVKDFITGQLSVEHQEIIQKLDIKQKPIKEYALEHNISEATVRVRRHRARKELKKHILSLCGCLAGKPFDCHCD